MPTSTDFHVTVFEAMPSPIFVVDRDLCVIDFNAAAAGFADPSVFSAVRLGGREVLNCVESEVGGCGTSAGCRGCLIRKSMEEALAGGSVCRRAVRMHLRRGRAEAIEEADFLVTAAPFRDGSEPLVLLILEDLGEMAKLRDRAFALTEQRSIASSARSGK